MRGALSNRTNTAGSQALSMQKIGPTFSLAPGGKNLYSAPEIQRPEPRRLGDQRGRGAARECDLFFMGETALP
jgi:hypothetical protein